MSGGLNAISRRRLLHAVQMCYSAGGGQRWVSRAVPYSEDQVILVDGEDRSQGAAEKLAAHRQGLRHRAFSILIWSADGRMLLQKRHPLKYHSGGLWTNACCGHPRPEEDIAAAAHRRLGEELGFDCALTPLGVIGYRAAVSNGLIEHEIVHVFRGQYDGHIRPSAVEVEATRWVQLKDVGVEIERRPDAFSIWFRQYVAAEWPIALAPPRPVPHIDGVT